MTRDSGWNISNPAGALTTERKYARVHPDNHRVMHRLHTEFGLTYVQLADLFDCSASRVKQVTAPFRRE